jgi:phytoene synthase
MRRSSSPAALLLHWVKERARTAAESAVDPEAAHVTRNSRSNFYYAFLFLPKQRRRAIYNVYAYCRLIDDIVDGPESVAQKERALEEWRRELDQAFFEGSPDHPIARGLQEAHQRFGLRYEDALAVLQGCELDLHKSRYETWDELEEYCYLVASAVGLLCIALFGCTEERSREYAVHLGQALQLTNILRDIGEDAARDRIYVPQEALEAHGLTDEDLLSGQSSPGAAALLREIAARARAEYAQAQAALPRADRRVLVPAEIMGSIYFALLKEVERQGLAVLRPGRRIALPKEKKVAVALSAVGQTLLPLLVPDRFSELFRPADPQ